MTIRFFSERDIKPAVFIEHKQRASLLVFRR